MKTVKHRQTKVSYLGGFSLSMLAGIASPYYRIDRSNNLILRTMGTYKAVITNYINDNGNIAVVMNIIRTSDGVLISSPTTLDLTNINITDAVSLKTQTLNAVIAFFAADSITITAADIVFAQDSALASIPSAPSSYQTIVSQTGTSAPAVSGSLVPTSTYPSGTTFTWARTGTGVYTLTASTAVFNTSGKTGVFVGALNNLNASYKTVVTSSTVVTITTAIGSLLGLGLLGLTATNTDALLSNTMIYVQTYA